MDKDWLYAIVITIGMCIGALLIIYVGLEVREFFDGLERTG